MESTSRELTDATVTMVSYTVKLEVFYSLYISKHYIVKLYDDIHL